MANPLITSLQVVGIGMVLLFIFLGALAGLVYWMTSVIKEPKQEEAAEAEPPEKADQSSVKKRVAVIAVALARAQVEMSSYSLPEEEDRFNSWREFYRFHQMSRSVPTRRP